MPEASSSRLVKTSKFLSRVLRHDPGSIDLALDEGGWADVSDLIDRSKGRLDREIIARVVETSDKKRFALSADGSRMRANQGHSIDVDLGLKAVEPPDTLYHGTATRFLASIMATGLEKRRRHHVHLSADLETARKVGRRHGKLVVLALPAREMHEAGQAFYLSQNGVWLTDAVSPDRLTVIEEDEEMIEGKAV